VNHSPQASLYLKKRR